MTPPQIRTLRRKLQISAEDFATSLGFTGKDRRVTVWRWENGKRRPSEQTMLLMKAIQTNA